MLADKFVEGAKAAGNDVEKISLVGKDIQFCKGCFACQKLGRCVIKDDVNDIMAKVLCCKCRPQSSTPPESSTPLWTWTV